MKKVVLLSAIFLSYNCLNAQTWQWAKAMGAISDDEGFSITFDTYGNVYTTGYFFGTVDFDPGPGIYNLTDTGTFISKLDAFGNFIWARTIGGTAYSISLDALGNIYTLGTFIGTADFDPGPGVFNLTAMNTDLFICKLDSSGNFAWAKQISGTAFGDVVGVSLTIDNFGNIYATGYFYEQADFDPGPGTFILTTSFSIYDDAFVLKLDSAGNFVWAKSFTGSGDSYSNFITRDAFGNIYITGALYAGPVDFDPGAGAFNLTSSGYQDIFISKLDGAGNFVWAKKMGGLDDEYGISTAVDDSSNVYTTGWFQDTADFDPGPGSFHLTSNGSSDIFISKLDASGNFVWAKAIGGTGADAGFSIAFDSSTNVYVAGVFCTTVDFDPGPSTFNLTSNGPSDITILKLNSSGHFVWAIAAGGANDERAISVAVDAFGNVYSTGSFFSPSVTCGSDTLINADNSGNTYDIFIAKLIGNCAAHFGLYPDTSQLHTYWAVNNASGTPPLSYDWDWGDSGPHDFAPYPSHTYAVAGFYTICLSITDALGCSSAYCDTFTLARMNTVNTMVYVNVVESIPTGSLETQLGENIFLVPNPATYEIRFEGLTFNVVQFEMYDVLGNRVYPSLINLQKGASVDVSMLIPGIYSVAIKDEKNNLLVRKFVKM